MTWVNKIEIALFISFGLLLFYLSYTMLLEYWRKNQVMNQVIVNDLQNPYKVSGKQEFVFQLGFESAVKFNILNEDESLLATLIDEKRKIGSHSLIYDCSRLKKGWYWYQIRTPQQNIIRKFKVI